MIDVCSSKDDAHCSGSEACSSEDDTHSSEGDIHRTVSLSPGIEHDSIVLPRQNNNIVPCLLGVLQTCGNLFLAVRRVGLDDPLRVSC